MYAEMRSNKNTVASYEKTKKKERISDSMTDSVSSAGASILGVRRKKWIRARKTSKMIPLE